MMKRLRKALLFALSLLPVSALGAYCTALYQLDFIDEAALSQLMEQLGSTGAFIAVYMVQILVYVLVMGTVGHLLAEKLGLMKPIRLEKTALIQTLPLCVLAGLLFSLDYWTFGAWIPGLQESTDTTLSLHVVVASVLYGGVVEEVMMRLFLMSLLAWIGWKIFFRQHVKAPVQVIVAANVLAALLFAAGHLPATVMLFGQLTPLLLVRCFLLNGGFGLFFGWLYQRYGIQYAMLGHALAHIVSKLMWAMFI